MEDAGAQDISKEDEDANTENSHGKAVSQREQDTLGDAAFSPLRLCPGHAGQQKHRHGIGDGGGKEDEGQCHTGQHSVHGKCLRSGQPRCLQTVGNPNGFRAGQQVQNQSVAHEGQRQGEQGQGDILAEEGARSCVSVAGGAGVNVVILETRV